MLGLIGVLIRAERNGVMIRVRLQSGYPIAAAGLAGAATGGPHDCDHTRALLLGDSDSLGKSTKTASVIRPLKQDRIERVLSFRK